MDRWTICNKTADFESIKEKFGVSDIMARLLVNRGLTDPEVIRTFLSPSTADLHSPHLLMNMDGAAALLLKIIEEGRRIRVVGDYDVDGIMATYILNDALRLSGADADWYIPHRIRDGYGLNEEIIKKAAADGVDTVVTCDNGIAAVAASLEAEKHGITLIVTDHHEIPEILPHAAFIVDPKQKEDGYPCPEICGAVVAAKLAQVLFELKGIDADITRYIEFMAMATICDVVPLYGENRVIAKLGTEALKTTSNPGLSALLDETAIDRETLGEYHIGFILGPCFNATGRIDDAGLAFSLLSAKDAAEAARIAHECRELNDERKVMTAEQEAVAAELLGPAEELSDRVIVLELPDCHESILGIIAGRIKERYNRPAIVVTESGDGYKGSARSIPAYNMFEELTKCKKYLVRFGGHPMAAGLTLQKDKLADFRDALNAGCTLTETDMCRKILIDMEVSFNLFTEDVVAEIEALAPFGAGNCSPLFAERGLKCRSIKYIGKENNYLRFRLINSFGHEFTATCFLDAQSVISQLADRFGRSEVDRALAGGSNSVSFTAAYVPKLNVYRDIKDIQMNIKYIKV
ncbi:MAG: single-stranded-DNA-specific exonuclease RecJ [Lachnospiraceae bacterium]|nr:single-stranded-DNA-specific exonuclease RecJ [Lachnospiraceae bacterium]